jgi:hypothetical protein
VPVHIVCQDNRYHQVVSETCVGRREITLPDCLVIIVPPSKEAEEAGRGVSKSGFVATAIRELSVGLCRGNCYTYRAAWGLLAQVTGHGFCAGADRPTDEVV